MVNFEAYSSIISWEAIPTLVIARRGDIQTAQMWGLTFPRKVISLPKVISWHKPSTGEFKLNVDGSSINNFQNAGGGGLLRDHTSTLVFVFSENLGAKNSLQAELLALHRGLLLCQENNISRLWIEMDAMIVIQMLKEGHIGSHDSRYLWASIRQQLKLFSFRISHIHREGNQAADWLANRGHQHHGLQLYFEDYLESSKSDGFQFYDCIHSYAHKLNHFTIGISLIFS
ncbi:Uncharacterized protein TCM_043836 [Theobroma cacao]|uniref:RNase H type-1 domain-containing protein n=1 Tax=Theobroma cacao TaxID=3641 RepID=A0A061FQC1_THECC|nr:Uncharacterized protein TCM_043836 [Theobroma cacao]